MHNISLNIYFFDRSTLEPNFSRNGLADKLETFFYVKQRKNTFPFFGVCPNQDFLEKGYLLQCFYKNYQNDNFGNFESTLGYFQWF